MQITLHDKTVKVNRRQSTLLDLFTEISDLDVEVRDTFTRLIDNGKLFKFPNEFSLK